MTSPKNVAAPEAAGTTTWRQLLFIVVMNAAAWTALSAIGALTSLNDDLREDLHADYSAIFSVWMRNSLVLALLSAVLYVIFTYRPAWTASGRRIVLSYLAMLMVLLPLQLLHVFKLVLIDDGLSMSWQTLEHGIGQIDRFASLLRFSTTTAVFFAVVGLKAWQLSKARQREVEQAHAHSEALRFELIQQRAAALRAQLEPHFMFNALGAISALVRAKETDVALNGIHDLGELLRYALEASDRQWTSVANELAFVEQYLSLQHLRYGERMRVRLEGLSEELLSCEMPPLLLQPLVENALRHDLDCHEGTSDILIVFSLDREFVQLEVSNPIHANNSARPGVGLGLRTTAARVRSAYGDAATLSTSLDAGRFTVTLAFPQYAPGS